MIRYDVLKKATGKFIYTTGGSKKEIQFTLDGGNKSDGVVSLDVKSFVAFDYLKIEVNIETNRDIIIKDAKITAPLKYDDNDRIFCNGYQSWSASYLKKRGDKMPNFINKFTNFVFGNYGDSTFLQNHKRGEELHSWFYNYIQLDEEFVFFSAGCDETNAYTNIINDTARNKIIYSRDCKNLAVNGKFKLFDLFLFDGKKEEAFKEYFDFINFNKRKPKKISGYSTWYNYKNDINAQKIEANLAAYLDHKIPLDYFQIDDGWQNKVGDWLVPKEGFGTSMEVLSASIRNFKISAGLWMAPFIVEKDSDIYKNKKHWLLKKDGKLVKAGYNRNWSGWFYALDFYNEEVKNYLQEVIHTIYNVWNIDMIKFDYLYAAGLSVPANKTKAMVMTEVMDWIDQQSFGKKILASGIPLPAAYKRVDYCRIGTDSYNEWDFNWMKLLNNRERASTKNAINNTVLRHELNNYGFYNDSDVFMLGGKNNKLFQQEKITQLLINYIFSSVVASSDNLDTLSPENLKLYKSLFPLKNPEVNLCDFQENDKLTVFFAINKSEYLLVSNLGETNLTLNNPYEVVYNCLTKAVEQNKEIKLKAHESILYLNTNGDSLNNIKDMNHLFPEFS